MSDFSKLYEAVVKAISEFELEAEDKRKARAKMIPHLIKVHRIRHGLSKEALAQKLGVTRMEIFRWEKGDNMPREEAMKKLEDKKIVTPIEQLNVQNQTPEEADLKQWTCECCNKIQLANSKAFRIDSGQMFCTRCIKELRGYTAPR